MSDTQWPRFIVFQQTRGNAPHEYAGSVHAPDSELALLNARDVFVRRPECISLWVVRADHVFAKTAEELALESAHSAANLHADMLLENYCVFQKIGHKGVSRYIGDVQADSPINALQTALTTYPNPSVLVWWVFAEKHLRRSQPEDIEFMFAQAWDKTHFRDQSEFHTVAAMKQIKSKTDE